MTKYWVNPKLESFTHAQTVSRQARARAARAPPLGSRTSGKGIRKEQSGPFVRTAQSNISGARRGSTAPISPTVTQTWSSRPPPATASSPIRARWTPRRARRRRCGGGTPRIARTAPKTEEGHPARRRASSPRARARGRGAPGTSWSRPGPESRPRRPRGIALAGRPGTSSWTAPRRPTFDGSRAPRPTQPSTRSIGTSSTAAATTAP